MDRGRAVPSSAEPLSKRVVSWSVCVGGAQKDGLICLCGSRGGWDLGLPLRYPDRRSFVSLPHVSVGIFSYYPVCLCLSNDPCTSCSSLFNSDIVWSQTAIAVACAGSCSFLASSELFRALRGAERGVCGGGGAEAHFRRESEHSHPVVRHSGALAVLEK